MNRRLSILIAFVAAGSLGVSLSACNAPACGSGTVQQQQKDGTLKCIPTDVQAATTPCDVDGGDVVIVGGQCVAAVKCDPTSTVEINGYCVSNGGTTTATCRTPSPGHACVAGSILNFKDNQKSTVPIHVELYDPITLLSGGNPIATYDSPDGSSYVFQDFLAPQLTLIVVATGKTTPGFTVTGAAAQGISNGNIYRLDTYALPAADSAAWGFDLSQGAQVAKFYKDAKPSPNNVIANETMPVAGVTLTKDGAAAMGAAYFNDTLTAVDPSLMVTGMSGAALVASPIPMGGMFPTFSGSGPTASPITFEQLPGGSAPNLVLVTRFHPN
jgi:hypothetical protein